MASIEEKVEKIIEPIITNLGYTLYDVIYEKEAKDYYLRVFIDSEDGITLNDCEKVNDAITDKLDEENIIKDAYFLEVSSCGLERNLRKDKHLREQIGNKIELKLYKPIEKKKQITGTLIEFNNKYIKIQSEEKTIEIERKNISQIKTVYDWEE